VCDSKRQKSGCKQPRVWVEQVELKVWTRVSEFLSDEAALRRAVAKAQGGEADFEAERADHEKAISEADGKGAPLVDLLADALDSAITEATRERLAGISRELAGHRRALEVLASREASLAAVHARMDEAVVMVRSHLDSVLTVTYEGERPVGQPAARYPVPSLTPEQRRVVLQQLCCRMVLHGRDVAIDLTIPDVIQTCVPRDTRVSQRGAAAGRWRAGFTNVGVPA
jgi:hypothetical protein